MLRPKLAATRVHVVTAGRTVFGVHRPFGTHTRTHLVAFTHHAHALLLAHGVDAYVHKHGQWPPRDASFGDVLDDMLEPRMGKRLEHVDVRAVDLHDLAARIKGTDMVVSVLVDGSAAGQYEWSHVRPMRSLKAMRSRLAWVYDQPYETWLDPKPQNNILRWPPQAL